MRRVRVVTISLFFAASVGFTGCSTQGVATSVPPRMFREVHGLRVRIVLKDKSTSEILGGSNITVENSRVSSNVDRMVDKEAAEIANYVRRSATRP